MPEDKNIEKKDKKIGKEDIIKILKTVNDPEIGIDVWTLGLIYKIDIKKKDNERKIEIEMTFTTPFCPYGPIMIEMIKDKIKDRTAIRSVEVEVVFEPLWEPPQEVRDMLGL